MGDEKRFFTEKEKAAYEPPACPACGRRVDQAWIYVGTSWQPDSWTPGRWRCRTPECRYA